MNKAAIVASAYCLGHAPELAFLYGATPKTEREAYPESEFLRKLAEKGVQEYDAAARYAPNLTYIGVLEPEDLPGKAQPWHVNLEGQTARLGKYGEIMPEDEFLGFMDICDVFDLIRLEKGFAVRVREALAKHPLVTQAMLKRLEEGHAASDIEGLIKEEGALPLYFTGAAVGCCRRGHETDHNLSAYELLVNLACKAGGVLALLHLVKNAGIRPEDVDFVLECSEEAAGDMNQRGGGNFAKAIAEIAGCTSASGCDVRAFCAGPVNALIAAAGMVASGVRRNVAVIAGGAVPKLYMNAREHVKKDLPALENCLGAFGVLLGPPDGKHPVIRLDALGKHNVGAGASPQAVTSALVLEPLQKAGLGFTDVDRYAAELHNPEITLSAGAGNVPEANYKMIAALAVMKGVLDKNAMPTFIAERGLHGFAHTQGHIPSGVPYIGHAADAITAGKIKRAMIIGKGSLFLARLTNLADGASFLIEGPSAKEGSRESDKVPPEISVGAVGAVHDRQSPPASCVPIGLMSMGNELGREELLYGARLAMRLTPGVRVLPIGPVLSGYEDLEWVESGESETDIANAMDEALASGRIAGAVALHYPFPIGVSTIGCVAAPGNGRPLFLASSTGNAALERIEAMLRSAVYGLAVAKASGIPAPSLGVLNLEGATIVQRMLAKLHEGGYVFTLGQSRRADGGMILRGNDLLAGSVDVAVTDSLTGNMLVKLLSAFSAGGSCESVGWGYGPSVGEAWDKIVSIVSRVSGSTVIANALALTARMVRAKLPALVAAEMAIARAAGLHALLAECRKAFESASPESMLMPPEEPVDAELSGVDVLNAENAKFALWKRGIYAEPYMGCTGLVLKVSVSNKENARSILEELGFI